MILKLSPRQIFRVYLDLMRQKINIPRVLVQDLYDPRQP